MKKVFFAVMVTVVASGAAFAGGSAMSVLDSNASPSPESVLFPIPKASGSGSSLSKLVGRQVEPGAPYKMLKDHFERGIPAVEKDLTGWYSLLTVSSDAPDVFHGGLFVGERTPLNPDEGLLIQNLTEFRVRSLSLREMPGYFDNLSPSMLADVKLPSWYVTLLFSTVAGVAPEGVTCNIFGERENVVQYRKIGDFVFERNIFYSSEGKISKEVYSFFSRNVTPK